jgi:hypothetical protein
MVLLLQRDMTKDVKEIKEKMRVEMEVAREKRKSEYMALKVSSPTHSSNLYHFRAIHRGVNFMPSLCCPIFTPPYRVPFILKITIANFCM